MKKTLLSFLLLTFTILTIGQTQEEKDKIERLRIAFLTEELDLSVEEGQQFWPIYNEYQNEKTAVEEEVKEITKEMRKTENPSSSDVKKTIDRMAATKSQGVQLEQEYLTKSLQVLGPDKTLKLVKAEKEFRRQILKNLKEGGGQRGGQGPGGRRPGGK